MFPLFDHVAPLPTVYVRLDLIVELLAAWAFLTAGFTGWWWGLRWRSRARAAGWGRGNEPED
jgi:hypothetical protein